MTVYIDSSVFLAIFNGEKTGPEIRELFRELKKQKIKVITSIISVQEVSVASYKSAEIATDNHIKIHKFASSPWQKSKNLSLPEMHQESPEI